MIDSSDINLNIPDFSFPFPPYDIQEKFMVALYDALQGKRLGIFESPTGTGKSLSLICGALTWLKHHSQCEKDVLNEIIAKDASNDGNDKNWFNATIQNREIKEKQEIAKNKLSQIEKWEAKIENLYKEKERKLKYISKKPENENHEFTHPGKDSTIENNGTKDEDDDMLSERLLILDDYDSNEDSDEDNFENEEDGCLKIYYCSRTHSQLSQFIREVQKTKLSSSVTVVALASRLNLCINEDVNKLSNISLINERCLDLQQGSGGSSTLKDANGTTKKKKKMSGCEFRKQNGLQKLSDQILMQVQDLEELVTKAKSLKSCPYYSSRYSIKDAELVVLPYQSLLHKSTRKACNIKLKDNIVIVDEAHNLLETISNIHSVMLTLPQVCNCISQLSQYLERYEKRLSAKNLLNIKQIMFFIKALQRSLKYKDKDFSKMLTQHQFLCDTFTDNLNLFKLTKYIEKSKLAHKLHGFCRRFQGKITVECKETKLDAGTKSNTFDFLTKMAISKSGKGKDVDSSSDSISNETVENELVDDISVGSPFLILSQFLKALCCGNSDGRVIVSVEKEQRKGFVKYILMNPASQFHDIVKECRSVIVAGGTMSPMSEFRDQLFLSSGASMDRVVEFTCGHIVSGESILPISMERGPSNISLDFTFKNRSNTKLLDEVGRILVNVSNIVPGGIVCFLPSYDYEEKVYEYLHKSGVLAKLNLKKKVFREPKKSSKLDQVLSEYTKVIKETSCKVMGSTLTGCLIFSVVGGKMSEGINFNDDLGRCVIMLGLPYPNMYSVELKEKMGYLNTHYPCDADGKSAGSVLYENLCFKAVNQSIGRAIRHRNDYAAILLLDYRYSRPSSQKMIPKWIGDHMKICQNFGSAFGMIRNFFSEKKKMAED